jgi:hypothetical protein
MRKLLSKTLFFFHVVFVAFWYGLFFVPESVFPGRVSFHFYLTLVVVFHQFIWGFLLLPWTGRYRMVCILTTINQLIRGDKMSDSKNYDHSFTQEFFKGFGVRIPHRATTFITLLVLFAASLNYFRGQ